MHRWIKFMDSFYTSEYIHFWMLTTVIHKTHQDHRQNSSSSYHRCKTYGRACAHSTGIAIRVLTRQESWESRADHFTSCCCDAVIAIALFGRAISLPLMRLLPVYRHRSAGDESTSSDLEFLVWFWCVSSLAVGKWFQMLLVAENSSDEYDGFLIWQSKASGRMRRT